MLDLDLAALRSAYAEKSLAPADVIARIKARIAATQTYNVWIYVLSDEELQPYVDRLESLDPAASPLWGIPFAIKDNIDLAGIPTTAACPDFSTVPEESASVVVKLIAAGAIPMGKTNLDQFATGLVGTRSPYGPVRNAINPAMISGGSSAGSAVAVKLGLCSFSLGTDTAGSGRVPAALNGIVGFKPTRGWLSTSGVIPACRTLDCVSIFANSVDDARIVADIASGFDATDVYSREITFSGFDTVHPRYGRLDDVALQPCDHAHKSAYETFVAQLPNAHTCNTAFLFEAAELLYQGPWLAERYAGLAEFVKTNKVSFFPTTLGIIEEGARFTAAEAFRAQYRLAELRRQTQALFKSIDVLVLPTVPTNYMIEEVAQDPLNTNAHLGAYTNFVNLLDLCAVAIPADNFPDGLPFGVTLVGAAGCDHALLDLAESLMHCDKDSVQNSDLRARPGEFLLAVCGAHLTGQPLNSQLTDRGGYLVRQGTTSDYYRLYALPDNKRPALIRDTQNGQPIEVEVWSIPAHTVGSFVQGVLPPLGIGSVELSDGVWVNGFIAEPISTGDSKEITAYGGWNHYVAAKRG
ncbi:MAG: allophanate hydrolase [bacterium]